MPARKVHSVRTELEDCHKRNLADLRVSNLLIAQGREWNAELLRYLFIEEERLLIEQVRPTGRGSKDRYV